MSRSFNGSSDYLRNDTGIVTAAPVTIASWVTKSADVTSSEAVVSLINSATAFNRNTFALWMEYSGSGSTMFVDAVTSSATSSSIGVKESPLTMADYLGTWWHTAGVFASATSRTAYFNGSAGTTQTTSRVPSGINRVSVGVADGSSQQLFLLGGVAETGVWDAALTADEIASLAAGVCPLLVRPESLVAYWPLWGNYSPEIDRVGGFDLTVTGATKADHPRIINPSRAKIFLPAASAPGGDPESSLTRGKLIRGGLLRRRLVG